MQKPATIKEIASRLGVSVSTVSRALHDHPGIGLRTKQQVREMAAALNYEPNQAAISFKRGRSFTIGVVLPNLREDFFSIAINAIEEEAIQNRYTVLIGQSHDDMTREVQIVETMRKHRVDGVIISLAKDTDDHTHLQQLGEYGIPVVFFDRVPLLRDAFSVSCDLRHASAQLVDLLVSRGHQSIGFINGPVTMRATSEREAGFLEAMHRHGLKERALIQATNLEAGQTREAMASLLAARTPPTAIIAFNDYVALEAMKYAREQGYRINKDIFFASYANLPITGYLEEGLVASVEQFPYEQAQRAASMLMQLIQPPPGGEQLLRQQVLAAKVVMH